MEATAGWLAVLGSGEAADVADAPEVGAPGPQAAAGVGQRGAIDRLSGIGLVSVCASRGVDLPLNNLAADVGFNLRPRGIQLPAYHFFGCFTLRHSTSLAAVGLRPTN